MVNTVQLTADQLQNGDRIIYCRDTKYNAMGSEWSSVIVGEPHYDRLFTVEYIKSRWPSDRFIFTVDISKRGPQFDADGNPIYRYVKGKGWVYGG